MSWTPGTSVGERFKNTKGEWAEVIEYNSSLDVVVKFDSGVVLKVQTAALKAGYFRNPNIPSVFGVGYAGGHVPLSDKSTAYRCWQHMLGRCYNSKEAAYEGCSVDSVWHNYQNFRVWYFDSWKGKTGNWEIDKDLVCPKNLVYSPENCELLPREINNLIRKGKSRKGMNTGVFMDRHKFRAQCYGKGLGTYDTNKEAFAAYCVEKNRVVKELAEKHKDHLSSRAYTSLLKYDFKDYEDEV